MPDAIAKLRAGEEVEEVEEQQGAMGVYHCNFNYTGTGTTCTGKSTVNTVP
jgi:hypothetical protein